MFGELYNIVKVRYGKAGSTQSMSEWICVNTKIKGKPLNFEGYPFQKAIADDMHPGISVIKCSQVSIRAERQTAIDGNYSYVTIRGRRFAAKR